ncbi:MAG: hypothetical protein FJ240_08795 [Nitrospira sp.]|nr:hypothetical protein [Nitrospira sp.]
MKKRKNIRILLAFVSVLLVFGYFSVTYAVDPAIIQQPALQVLPMPDLVVRGIYGYHCPDCTCGRTNFGNHRLVEYLENIQVDVWNKGRAASAACTLKIEFYDVIGGRNVVLSKPIPALNPNQSINIVENGEFLFRKSTGIKATADSTGVVVESDEKNNTLTVQECIIYLI